MASEFLLTKGEGDDDDWIGIVGDAAAFGGERIASHGVTL